MRRGGPILLILVLVIVILIAAAFFLLSGGIPGLGATEVSPTAPVVEVVVARQPIGQDEVITDAVLETRGWQQSLVTEKMITDKQLVIGKYAAFPIPQGFPLSLDAVTDRPASGGSMVILPGQVAMSIPANELSLVGYAIKDGDYVNVIATTLFVDLDASFQTILPNVFGHVVNSGSPPDAAPLVVLGMVDVPRAGRAELDPTLNQVIYYIPSEPQRPRLVSQMILQDIQVLRVGTFPLVAQSGPQPTPEPGQPVPTPAPVAAPYIITLIVSPQDAVALTYLLNTAVKLTFTLRAPDDRSRAETEAATLQYLLSQYAIPVPAKLPYGIEPRLDQLGDSINVPTAVPPQ